MPSTLTEIEENARLLSPDDRARLAEVLLESLQEDALKEIATAWDSEIEARVAAYDRGEGKSYQAEEVFAEAKRLSR